MKDFAKETYKLFSELVFCYFSLLTIKPETIELYQIGRRAQITVKKIHEGDCY